MSEELPQIKEAGPTQEMTSADVVSLYTELENSGINIWVDGGWGVDALLGGQTRFHKDLDIAIQQKDVPKFRELLQAQGYKQIKEDSKWNFVLGDGNGHEVDVHSFIFDDQGNVVEGIMYPAATLTGTGTIDGHTVRCISPEYVVKFHSGYELKDNDFKDVYAICEKFDLELPEEYGHLKKTR
jgi:lincosamide nucleotidyltransferase A/C/D/E